jgi:5'-deoxynucleotidase
MLTDRSGEAAKPVRKIPKLNRLTAGHRMSHFFAYLSRMKFIRRWGLMYNTYTENIQEHSLRVALIAHSLAIIRNRLFGGHVDPERAASLALYHDATEVLTGDLPAPIKYFNPEIREASRGIESAAAKQLFEMIPPELKGDYEPFLFQGKADPVLREIVKAADKLCAYMKCLEELGAGNQEFSKAEKALRQTLEQIDLPEVRYFLETFVPSSKLTLDELS